ncbi:DUF4374 domain-containing protein [Sunxiuqinia indica]|uniref:DUF4374 domain-containing protein n=1 Tax=Sunxiuqinia indica TaxID=2692584 RepID=UPI0013592720|nr:DUF4374 domain-containing protein [Sunxiuqinia indica]
MKILNTQQAILALSLLLGTMGITSCTEDNTVVDEPEEEEATGYVIALRASDGDASADYLLTHDDLMSGVISADGQGEEQSGWSYFTSAGDNYFSVGYTLNEVISYQIQDGNLIFDDKLLFDRLDMLYPVDDNHIVGIGAPWGGGSYDCQIQLIDVNNVAISRNISHPIYESYDEEGVQLNAWPTAAYVAGDQLYVSSYSLYGDTWETPNTDSAIVSVFSYPEFEYQGYFSDDRTGPVGYYASQPAILENENGDHYTLSSSSLAAGFTQTTKPSGILKINQGEQAFDSNYFFNIEEHGYKVLSGVYVGNNKAVVKVVSLENDAIDASWAAFGNELVMETAVIDLEAQTFELVESIPVHRGQYMTPYYVENDLVYLVVGTESEWYIYQVNPETVTAERGAQIEGIDVQGIFKY